MQRDVILECPAVVAGTEGPPVVLVAGPPASAALFREVQRRLAPRRSIAVDLLGGEAVALSRTLSSVLKEVGARTLVAHGLALPVALAVEPERLDHLVMLNGPLSRLDPILRGVRRMPSRLLTSLLLQPAVAGRLLASSAGLRRTVTNPYAMHRDIVVMLAEPWTTTPEGRERAAAWLRGVDAWLPARPLTGVHHLAIWGDADVLYPSQEAREFVTGAASGDWIPVQRGRHYFVEERPWLVADALKERGL
ncbi:MAG: hypothetical protein H6739_19050 [Alphaproteobacteria bacterium]|nr:hypothetical protein [Alphaproteobacteria bacterium]